MENLNENKIWRARAEVGAECVVNKKECCITWQWWLSCSLRRSRLIVLACRIGHEDGAKGLTVCLWLSCMECVVSDLLSATWVKPTLGDTCSCQYRGGTQNKGGEELRFKPHYGTEGIPSLTQAPHNSQIQLRSSCDP